MLASTASVSQPSFAEGKIFTVVFLRLNMVGNEGLPAPVLRPPCLCFIVLRFSRSTMRAFKRRYKPQSVNTKIKRSRGIIVSLRVTFVFLLGISTLDMRAEEKRGQWFQTYTGRKFWPLSPHVQDFDIKDVAHHLANICRFGGATKKFYSVASHSVHVSHLCPPHLAFEGLLHDGPEAYLGDVIRPLKYQMPQYLDIEHYAWRMFAMRFGLPLHISPEVKMADNIALVTERRDLLIHTENRWSEELEAVTPDKKHVVARSPKYAEAEFLDRFYFLQSARNRT